MNNIVEQYLKALEHGTPSMELTMAYRKYKCGGKTKKKEDGGEILEEKCGGKTKKKKVSKAQEGEKVTKPKINLLKFKKPYTGFESLTFEYDFPRPSTQGRADYPGRETIYNNGKYIMDKETYYDPEVYEATGKLKQIDEPIYSMSTNNIGWTQNLNETQLRAFKHLKRHALANNPIKITTSWKE